MALRRSRTSHLSAAMANDSELYEAQVEQFGEPEPSKSSSAPELTEFGLLESLVMGLTEQLQVITHVAARQKGKPKVKELPRPKTAAQRYKKEMAKKAAQQLESIINFVPVEEFEAQEKGPVYGDIFRR